MPVPGEENLTSDADYALLGLRPETLRQIPIATRDAMRGMGQDVVFSYLGSQVKRPLTTIDASLKRAAIVMALVAAIEWKHWAPQGPDAETFNRIHERTLKWLESLSDPNKDVKPYYVDSTPADDERGPLASSSATSDSWARANGCGCARQRIPGCR